MKADSIRTATADDAAGIAAIYNYYVSHTIVTFEETPIADAEMAQRIARIGAEYPWLVFERGGAVVAYAYAARFHARSAYRFTAETAIYAAHGARGSGIGTQLYRQLLDRLRERGLHCALGGIALPNEASVRLHEKCGFVKVTHYREVGWKLDRWIDVGYWQLLL